MEKNVRKEGKWKEEEVGRVRGWKEGGNKKRQEEGRDGKG